MTAGVAPVRVDLLKGTGSFVADRVGPDSVFAFLHRECHNLFPDDMFDDLFSVRGRRSVAPRIVAVVMVLQRLHGLSDREAVEAFEFDARWKYAAGGLDFDFPGFTHTVLVEFRARLAQSDNPNRIFEASKAPAKAAGVMSKKRVLDSTPLYDAIATMDTVTLIRSAIRALLAVAEADLASRLRAVLVRDDDYRGPGKPVCDWDDRAAREALIDELARDGYAALGVIDGEVLDPDVAQAAELLATVLGQDLETTEDGVFKIARRVAKDRVISTVDPTARHGHKTAARGFDGHKGHVAIDPESEMITDTKVTPGNVGDGAVAADLIDDLLTDSDTDEGEGVVSDGGAGGDGDGPEVLGDAAYGTGEFQKLLEDHGIESGCKTQPPNAPKGRFAKDRFVIDLDVDTVTCPNDVTVTITRHRDGTGKASFGSVCATCPLREQCTASPKGRMINVGIYEAALTRAREKQRDQKWKDNYRATRPKVERKLGHLMRRKHGGRRSRVRGTVKIEADFSLLAAAQNIARLAALRIASNSSNGWVAA